MTQRRTLPGFVGFLAAIAARPLPKPFVIDGPASVIPNHSASKSTLSRRFRHRASGDSDGSARLASAQAFAHASLAASSA